MKLTLLLRAVYILVKSNGLAAFSLSIQSTKPVAELTRFSTGLAILLLSILNCIFAWVLSKNFIYLNEKDEEILLLVVKLDSFAFLLRNLIISVLVIMQRSKIVQLINDVYLIAFKIQQKGRIESFLDSKCLEMVHVQIRAMLTQLGISILSIYLHSRYVRKKLFYDWVRVLSTTIFSTTVSVMIFTVFLIVVQLIRQINHQLRECVKTIRMISQMDKRQNIRMQIYCNLSDDVDEIASLFKFVHICNQRICKVFSVMLLMVLVTSFMFILCSVIEC